MTITTANINWKAGTEEQTLDLFEFILIITSVIYALAVAQILSGISRLAQTPAAMVRKKRGHHGVVHRHHGVHRFQDHVDGKDVGQQHLYTVMFTGPELWGSRAHPKDVIYAELWDYHLQPAA